MGQNPWLAKEKSKTNPTLRTAPEKEWRKSLKLCNKFCNIDIVYNNPLHIAKNKR